MLAISPVYRNGSIYLYPSVGAADAGRGYGGSGFMVSVPSSTKQNTIHLYAVTNRHVLTNGNHVIRFNTKAGASSVATRPDEWTVAVHDDLAVLPIDPPAGWEPGYIGVDLFLTADCKIAGFPIFPGDHVMFFGRFVSHEGQQRNNPVVRYGNISMLPDDDEPIALGHTSQVAFLVECRSLGGFSGSPAIITLADARLGGDKKGFIPTNELRFLGVDCGHLPFWSAISSHRGPGAQLPGMWAETNSGMAVVIPAWRLRALLDDPELLRRRADEDTMPAESIWQARTETDGD